MRNAAIEAASRFDFTEMIAACDFVKALPERFRSIMHIPFPDPNTIPNADDIIPPPPMQQTRVIQLEPNDLIEEVLIHPQAGDHDVELVMEAAGRFNLIAPIRKSELLQPYKIPPVT